VFVFVILWDLVLFTGRYRMAGKSRKRFEFPIREDLAAAVFVVAAVLRAGQFFFVSSPYRPRVEFQEMEDLRMVCATIEAVRDGKVPKCNEDARLIEKAFRKTEQALFGNRQSVNWLIEELRLLDTTTQHEPHEGRWELLTFLEYFHRQLGR
jgi:hypothetical protein